MHIHRFHKKTQLYHKQKKSENLNEDVIFTSNLEKRIFPDGLESGHKISGLANVFYSKNIGIYDAKLNFQK